jgi:hypothetical protein
VAVKEIVFVCDYCETETDEYEDEEDAVQSGWYLLTGPGFDGPKDAAYCSLQCLEADL